MYQRERVTRSCEEILRHVVRKAKAKVTLQRATKSQRGSKGIALYCSFNLGAVGGWVVPATLRLFYPR